jgi:hypothetical protein
LIHLAGSVWRENEDLHLVIGDLVLITGPATSGAPEWHAGVKLGALTADPKSFPGSASFVLHLSTEQARLEVAKAAEAFEATLAEPSTAAPAPAPKLTAAPAPGPKAPSKPAFVKKVTPK